MYKAAGAIGFVAAIGFESRKFIVIPGQASIRKEHAVASVIRDRYGRGIASGGLRSELHAFRARGILPGRLCVGPGARELPPSSLFVLSVGGTMLTGTPPAEVVWWAARGDQSQGGGGGSTDGGVASRSARPYVRTSHRAITTHLASLRAMWPGWGTTP